MLVIISDLHLADGTCGRSISQSAFDLFLDRLRELVYRASWRADGSYRPIQQFDILLLGDILELQHSRRWLEKEDGSKQIIRPWSETAAPEYSNTVHAITKGILRNNNQVAKFLRDLAAGQLLSLSPANRQGSPARFPLRRLPVKANIHYMVGNHDWFLHLPGVGFNAIRADVIEALGLSNSIDPFPHQASESAPLEKLLASHHVHAQHGDLYDSFNYNRNSMLESKRDSASLGDAFAVEIINRFPLEVENQMQGELPAGFMASLRELVNVRPVLATPLWISNQLRQNNIPLNLQQKLKAIWDELGDQFLELPFVRSIDKKMKLDLVDGLKALIRITNRFSFDALDRLVVWIRNTFGSEEITFAKHALKEKVFLNHEAQFIVYGHTHRYEIVPLDSIPTSPKPTNQLYMNSGTWHSYFDLAIHKPEDQKFIPYQVMSYLTFFRDGEYGGRQFETWSGSFSM